MIFALSSFQGVGGWRGGLKTCFLGLLALWYALAAVTFVQEVTGTGRYHTPVGHEGMVLEALTGLSACLALGAVGAWSKRQTWLVPGIAVAACLALEASRLASLSGQVNWREEILPMAVAFSIWAGLSMLVSLTLKRWLAPVLRGHHRLHLAIVGIAGLGTGLTVLLQPHKLQLLLNLFFAAWPDEWLMPDDGMLALYYSLGGLAAGFTWRLLWPALEPLPRVAALILAGCWCAIALRTLLDPFSSQALLFQLQEPAPVALLLLPIAMACFSGMGLARWPSRWARHA